MIEATKEENVAGGTEKEEQRTRGVLALFSLEIEAVSHV